MHDSASATTEPACTARLRQARPEIRWIRVRLGFGTRTFPELAAYCSLQQGEHSIMKLGTSDSKQQAHRFTFRNTPQQA